jgi:hypothetical protein
MKFEATIVVTLHAYSVSEAGAMVDDVLHSANMRDGVEVRSVDVHTPVGAGQVALPRVAAATEAPAHVPHPQPGAGR